MHVRADVAQASAQCGAQVPQDLKAKLFETCRLPSSELAPSDQHAGNERRGPVVNATAAVAGLSIAAGTLTPPAELSDRAACHACLLQTHRPLVAIAFAQRAYTIEADAAMLTLAQSASGGGCSARLAGMGCIAVWDTSQPESVHAVCVVESEVTCFAAGRGAMRAVLVGGASDGSLCCWNLRSAPDDRLQLEHGSCALHLPCQHTQAHAQVARSAEATHVSAVLCVRACSAAGSAEAASSFQFLALHEGGRVDAWSVQVGNGQQRGFGRGSQSGSDSTKSARLRL